MLVKIKDLFYNKILRKEGYGVSFDNKVKLKKLPVLIPSTNSVFYKLNNDLGIFEVKSITKFLDLIYMVEVGTDNEFVCNQKLFECLFTNIPIPKEIEF